MKKQNLIFKCLEDKWTYCYMEKLQAFVSTVKLRTNRVSKLTPNKVTKKDVPRLKLLRAEKTRKLGRQPKLNNGELNRKATNDIPFQKSYKQ